VYFVAVNTSGVSVIRQPGLVIKYGLPALYKHTYIVHIQEGRKHFDIIHSVLYEIKVCNKGTYVRVIGKITKRV